ncbi:MAG: hypothetical protein GX374_04005 [Bacilli bacterium]|nr:hypothetical protein [Bacilli bacterium]
MRSLLFPFLFFCVTIVVAFLNLLALMRLLPLYLTLPLLFFSIYATLYTFFNRNLHRRVRKRF